LNKAILDNNFFHGVNPYKISSKLLSNPALSEVKILNPWLWNFEPRVYAVCAIETKRITS
jgi:hypothetical protein